MAFWSSLSGKRGQRAESCWEKICELEATTGWSCVVMVSLLLAHVKAACAMTMVSDVPLDSGTNK